MIRRSTQARGRGRSGRIGPRMAVLVAALVSSACTAARPAIVVGSPADASPTSPPRVAPALAAAAPVTAAPVTEPPTTAPASTTAPDVTTTTTTVAPSTTAAVPPPAGPPPSAAPTMITEVAPLATAFERDLRQGSAGDDVRALQQRLIDLGFWIDEVDGEYGFVTTQAVMAFQKYYGGFYVLKPSGAADAATIQVLRSLTTRPHGDSTDGDRIEVDKARQVLFVIRGGKASWVLNTSTGSGKTYTEVNQKDGGTITDTAITPEGNFKVYREYSDGWEHGQLGQLYRPKYFKGGVAVHGLYSIPNYPASHGCVRVSLAAMDWIWANDLMPRGTEVWVH